MTVELTDDRSADRLHAIFVLYSIPSSGCRTADLEALEIAHFTVNHTEGLVNVETGIHTNKLEAT